MCFPSSGTQNLFFCRGAPEEARADSGGDEAERNYCSEETTEVNGMSVLEWLYVGGRLRKGKDRTYFQVIGLNDRLE